MHSTSLHVLLTYQCNYQCDHCFVWGSPWQKGTFTIAQLVDVFQQTSEVDSIEEFYFEGGEAFLYYPLLVEAVSHATMLGFSTGVVSNGYWAKSVGDAELWLQPLARAGLDHLELSCDAFHGDANQEVRTHNAVAAARKLQLEASLISLDPPTGYRDQDAAARGLPIDGGGVMFRGRAADRLTPGLPQQPWNTFSECPYENLVDPGRIHLDPLGNLHLCQGIVIGNLFEQPLKEILQTYQPHKHPVVGPLLAGGPARLVTHFGVEHEPGYVDACHLCYRARQALRARFPAVLAPDQMYGLM